LLITLITPPILVAITFHEVAHGLVAYKLGDPTAKMAGRLTLNPFKHLDVLGTLVFIITRMVGWAKPVPINPYNLKNPRRDMIFISLAGPITNIIIAVVSAICYKILISLPVNNFFLIDKLILPLSIMLRFSITLNIGLGIFNLIPIPPLDGSKVLMGLLPRIFSIYENKIFSLYFMIFWIILFIKGGDNIISSIIFFFENILNMIFKYKVSF